MTNGVYRFVRCHSSVEGFISSNRPSTDAIKAIDAWANAKSERSYVVVQDEDEFLVSQLTWGLSDSCAGGDLDEISHKCGVKYSFEGGCSEVARS